MKNRILTLVTGDIKLILRDSTLILAIFGPLAIFLLLLVLPVIEQFIENRFGFNLESYRLFAVSFLSLIPGMLFGMIYGFIMLDERDEDIITYISITPLQKKGYLKYKLLIPMILSSLLFLAIIYGTNLIDLDPIYAFSMALLIGLEAGIGALFLVAYADNKVEGLAFSKIMGVMYLGFPAVFLWDSPWHWTTAGLPPFWIAKAFLHSSQGSSLIWSDLTLGLLVHAGFFVYLLRAFLNRQR